MADFAGRISQGHIGRARYLATNETVRSQRKQIIQIPLQLGSLQAAFQAAQILVDLSTQEARLSSEERDLSETEKLQEAYGKGTTGRGMATGGAKAVKELEKEQKSRFTRMVRDSIDLALQDITTFYRDVMMVQSGNDTSIINTDMREQIESHASSSPAYSIILKMDALMQARANLAQNAAPLVTCEALMCRLAMR
jgi:DNA polymerase-3 subunit delta'